MKIVSFNANGLRSAERKNFYPWARERDFDIICVQETRAQAEQIAGEKFELPGYHFTLVEAEKKGYSGVAIYAKKAPIKIETELGFDVSDREGRYVAYHYEDFIVVSLYLPSGTSGDIRQAEKYRFMDAFEARMDLWQKNNQSVIICGDWNIAHQKRDIKNWRGNLKNSGFLPEERAWLDKLFDEKGWVDGFRAVNQEDDQYTWWSNRGRAYENNVGWRIDYHVTTPDWQSKIQGAEIYKTEKFSDHAPLILEYDYSL